jgi:hypothetical protein
MTTGRRGKRRRPGLWTPLPEGEVGSVRSGVLSHRQQTTPT